MLREIREFKKTHLKSHNKRMLRSHKCNSILRKWKFQCTPPIRAFDVRKNAIPWTTIPLNSLNQSLPSPPTTDNIPAFPWCQPRWGQQEGNCSLQSVSRRNVRCHSTPYLYVVYPAHSRKGFDLWKENFACHTERVPSRHVNPAQVLSVSLPRTVAVSTMSHIIFNFLSFRSSDFLVERKMTNLEPCPRPPKWACWRWAEICFTAWQVDDDDDDANDDTACFVPVGR